MATAKKSSSTDLLEGLLKEIDHHGQRHRCSGSEALSEERCRSMLIKIRRIVASLVSHFLHPKAPRKLLLSCRLLRVILAGVFCPYATAVFGDGDVALVAPPLLKLVSLLAEPSVASLQPQLLVNIAALLDMLSGKDLQAYVLIFEEAVLLLQDWK